MAYAIYPLKGSRIAASLLISLFFICDLAILLSAVPIVIKLLLLSFTTWELINLLRYYLQLAKANSPIAFGYYPNTKYQWCVIYRNGRVFYAEVAKESTLLPHFLLLKLRNHCLKSYLLIFPDSLEKAHFRTILTKLILMLRF